VLCGTNQPLVAQTEFLEITIPLQVGISPPARTPIATYYWRTFAGNPDPVEVRWIMVSTANHDNDWYQTEDYIRNNPDAPEWSPWHPYSPPGVGTYWTSPPTPFGTYVFAVQGKGASGEVDEDFVLARNMRRVLISARTNGPVLTVTGDTIDDIITASTSTPVTEVGLAAGTPVSFCWTGDASEYGLVVVAYRYNWDVIDPDNDEDWDMPFTPFGQEQECSVDQVFNSGVHTFYIEIIDIDGFKSRVPIQITYSLLPVKNTTWGRIKALYPR